MTGIKSPKIFFKQTSLCLLEVVPYPLVMVNFTSQLDWATGHPDIWSDVILIASVVF